MMMMMMKMNMGEKLHFDLEVKRTNGADAYIKTKVTTYLNNH